MNIKVLLMVGGLALASVQTSAADGLTTVTSAHPVKVTMDRLETALGKAGFKIFARVDHGAGAKSVDLALAPTELLIFGKPEAGTLLMQSQRSVGIDLPLKYLVWEDADGKVQVGWNDPAWIAARHGIADKAAVVDKISGALAKFAGEAAKP
ncbi:MAG: DUF302 domain-containing protein [Gammaproteobacteria bacterium]|nr:DUF302 domain-containing protein [Gammaproteobacteria bacterium]